MIDKCNSEIGNEKRDKIIKTLKGSPQFKISFFKLLTARDSFHTFKIED